MQWDEAWDDDADEDYFDASLDDDETEIVCCPECGSDVYEDAEQCPHCGQYIVHHHAGYAWRGRPLWWTALGLMGMLAVILFLVF